MNLPEIRQLKIFIALEETRSFTAAANKNFITQSAVSHSIKSLEKQLDCSLIERMGKRITLTPYGEVFLHHAKRVIAELESSLTKIETLKHWGYSSIRVGASDTICQYILPAVLREFAKKHPKCEVTVDLGDTMAMQKKLAHGQLDLAIGIHLAPSDNNFIFTPLTEDTLCFVTSPDHDWVQRQTNRGGSLTDVRLIAYGAESETMRLITKHFSENVVKYRHPLSLGNMEAIKEMTKIGLGVGIIPPWVAKKEFEKGELIAHTISSPPPRRNWGVFSNSGKTFSLPEEEFIGLCRDQMDQAIHTGKKLEEIGA
ncbi:LysR family transcriptional regulator [Rubritalea spongiae]|uniref:LysR family transcriptional regulator n=1 Tax=Rubritalea spongiae TaxID=430797 RepID=A0ABW5E104_9BACT